MKPRHKQSLISGLAYGFGLLFGNAVSFFIFDNVDADLFLTGNTAVRLVLGIFLAFFIAGIGGLIGGSIGGYTLPLVGISKERSGYIWRSGTTFGFGYGLLIFPLILIISLLSFYDISNTPFWVFSLIFGIVGVIFGLLMGISLGLWTVGRRFRPITQYTVLGFGIGGLILGYTLWQYIFTVTNGETRNGVVTWIILGFFAFAALGGAGLGYAYQRMAEQPDKEIVPIRALTKRVWRRRWMLIGFGLVALAFLIRPILSAVGDLLTPIDAQLSPVLDLHTEGTHWFDTTPITAISTLPQPTISANGNELALTWIQDEQLLLQNGQWVAEDQQTTWQAPIIVSEAPGISEPQVAVDINGRSHLIWIQDGTFASSQCESDTCTEPQRAFTSTSNECAAPPPTNPTLAISGNTVMVAWENSAKTVSYAAWLADGQPDSVTAFCLPTTGEATEPQLAAGQNDTFNLVYSGENNAIETIEFTNGEWGQSEIVGNGRFPTNLIDNSGQPHIAWCADETIDYWNDNQTETISPAPDCVTAPRLAQDSDGKLHAIWFQNAIENVNEAIQSTSVIVESIQASDGWTSPAIVEANQPDNQPVLTAVADGSLHLAWADTENLKYAAQVQYECDTEDLSLYGQVLYDIARQERYTPAEDIIPFCQNRYEQLLITPNPDPAYSDAPMPPNGVYDIMGDYIREAEYEVLYSTMWYSKATNHDSPGAVIAAAVADLYEKIKANPEQYPRGMTVRIMLGNPPELAMGEMTGQLWTLINDLQYAGVDTMVDDEIGWNLEVADFEGNLPHSHVKTLVVDGKIASANGFNMSYDHFPKDHISGQGGGRFDLGLMVVGPAAQATQRMFDDMWNGADQRHCFSLDLPPFIPWQATCFDKSATVTHVPEVSRFYLAGGSSDAFSMYRSKVHDQADVQTAALIETAQESIDAIHVNFALDMICNLNILFNVCTVDFSPGYMDALIQAAENGANVRVLVKPGPVEGIENNVAMDQLEKRLKELGVDQNLEVRYFDGAVHPKAVLVDDQVLVIGSQNFHYSAYGEGSGLTEYSIAIEDPQATQDFKDVFEYEWNRATPSQ